MKDIKVFLAWVKKSKIHGKICLLQLQEELHYMSDQLRAAVLAGKDLFA